MQVLGLQSDYRKAGGINGGHKLARTRSWNPSHVVKDLQVHKLSLAGGWLKRRLVVTKEELLICSRAVRSADLRHEGTFGKHLRPVALQLRALTRGAPTGMKIKKEAPFLQHYFVFEDGVLRFWPSKEDCQRGASPRGRINTRKYAEKCLREHVPHALGP